MGYVSGAKDENNSVLQLTMINRVLPEFSHKPDWSGDDLARRLSF
jgi:hypothetical protein